jgi:hypothetical protein
MFAELAMHSHRILGWVAPLCLSLIAQGALAQSPSEKDRSQFQSHLTVSVALLALGGSPAAALKECEAAQAFANRFTPSDLWRAGIESCFADVAYTQGQSATGCARYSAAAELYLKVHADPNAQSVESDYQRIRKRHSELRCPGRIAALPVRAVGASLTKKDLDAVSKELLTVYAIFQLAGTNAEKSATEKCVLVRSYASRFPGDPFMGGAVDECAARIEGFRKNKTTACTRYQAAESKYAAVPGAHPASADARGRVGSIREARMKLGC